MSTRRPTSSRLPRRVQALVAAGVAAFGVGLVCGATHQTKAEKAAKAFARAWGHGDTAGMYRSLSDDARKRFTLTAFRSAYRTDAATATASAWTIGHTKGKGDTFRIPVHVTTRIFGAIDGQVSVKASDSGVDWRPYMAFPGLRAGDRLARTTKLPPTRR